MWARGFDSHMNMKKKRRILHLIRKIIDSLFAVNGFYVFLFLLQYCQTKKHRCGLQFYGKKKKNSDKENEKKPWLGFMLHGRRVAGKRFEAMTFSGTTQAMFKSVCSIHKK